MIPLGRNCQSTFLIKDLGYRTQAYPFDWITSPIDSIVECLENDFKGFHEDLRLEQNDATHVYSQIVDRLGFRFHHDYPTYSAIEFAGGYGEDPIVSNWMDSYPAVYEKYMRRVQRFRDAMQNPKTIGICRRPIADCMRIREAIQKTYGRSLLLVTDTPEVSTDPMIQTVHSVRDWYDIDQWRSELPAKIALQAGDECSHGLIS